MIKTRDVHDVSPQVSGNEFLPDVTNISFSILDTNRDFFFFFFIYFVLFETDRVEIGGGIEGSRF